MNWPENLVSQVWGKATIVEGYDPDKYRKDACGAWIMRDKHGVIHNYGWEIDHIYPKSLGGNDDIENLRALHYLNNKSKGDDYPRYKVAVSSNGNRNEEVSRYIIVNEQTQKRLYVLYGNKT